MEHGREGGVFGVWDVSNCRCEISNILLQYLSSSLLTSHSLQRTAIVPTSFCLIAAGQPCSTAQYCGPPQEQLLNVPAPVGSLCPQAASLEVTIVQAWTLRYKCLCRILLGKQHWRPTIWGRKVTWWRDYGPVHWRNQDVLCFQNAVRFYCAGVAQIVFVPVTEGLPSLSELHVSCKSSAALCAKSLIPNLIFLLLDTR